jgi:ubiquinone/menaquinone biosynthesis C-methylase UbiE
MTKFSYEWDIYWKDATNLYSMICVFCRKTFIASSLSRVINQYFPSSGYFIDAGSGSSESCIKIDKSYGRKIIALDYSYNALKKGKKIKSINNFVNADLFSLPFKNDSIDGIFNLGVMEHFNEKDTIKILNEMNRVLKKDSYAIFFWARRYSPSNFILGTYSFLVNHLRNRKFWYTPDEISPFTSKIKIVDVVSKSKMSIFKIKPSFGTFLIHEVVICKKI